MKYHTGYPEKYWRFLYTLDAFLFFIAVVFVLSLIVEFGFELTEFKREVLGWFNVFVIGLSLIELFIKYLLSSSKSYFFGDEYGDFIFTNLLLAVTIYVGYIHLYKLGLPFKASFLVQPHILHWMVLKIVLFITVLTQFKEFNKILLGLKIKPVQLLVGGFFTLIILGSLLLLLPQSTTQYISTIDAIFMSTSATTVTGLIPLQPVTHFTLMGQLIILFLIQVGGLGIMTISAFVALILRGSFGIEGRRIMSESIEIKAQHHLYSLLKQIVRFTLLMELFGAIVFTWRFYGIFHDFSKALYYGIFHAISGFCNAGFSLFTDSLTRFQTDPYVLLTMSVLIVAGGIGFLVISDVNKFFSESRKVHRNRHMSMQTKVVLSLTAVLLLGGTLLIYFIEYQNQLAHLSFPYKLLNAFFQAVSPRTAGFNSIDIGLLNPATVLTIMAMMVIGGASGSTAGGIKVNTIGILFGLLRATAQGKSKVTLFERTIPDVTLKKAITITFFAMIIITTASLVFLVHDTFPFLPTIFEAISAFNTVGLSMGITTQVSDLMKVLFTVLMFLGRVGPVSFVVALAQREEQQVFIDYPEENILVG